MTNRSYMQTLNNDYFESTMYHVVNMNFDLADRIVDPTAAVMAWLYAEYDPNDRLWQEVRDDNDPSLWEDDEPVVPKKSDESSSLGTSNNA